MYTTDEILDGVRVSKKQPTARSTELGTALSAMRKREALTLREAAERIGVEHSTLSDLEHGKRRPDLETLVGIHRGYGYPLEELVRMAARDAALDLPVEPSPYRDLAARLAARSVVFPDLGKILGRLADSDPAAHRAFLLMLDLWDRQDDERR